MNSRNHINDELRDLNSGLPQDPGGSPFSVPEGYFEGLASSILNRIHENQDLSARDELAVLSPLLAGISRHMPYSVPEGYFSTNLEVLPEVLGEEKESLVLSFVEKEMPYSVPKGYFEELSYEIGQRVAPKAKVVALHKRKWMHVVAAALVAGIITLSGILYFQDSPSQESAPLAQQLKQVSTTELEEFIKNTNVTTGTKASQNSADVKRLLQDVSDQELEAFLDEIPTEEEEIAIN